MGGKLGQPPVSHENHFLIVLASSMIGLCSGHCHLGQCLLVCACGINACQLEYEAMQLPLVMRREAGQRKHKVCMQILKLEYEAMQLPLVMRREAGQRKHKVCMQILKLCC